MNLQENLREGDLSGVILPKISFDEFEPKTGDKHEVAVAGFYVTEQSAGEDLLGFLSKSKFNFRDIEVTPNPNPENHYMVFIEMDRKEGVLDLLREVAKDILNVSGEMTWSIKPLLSEDELDLDSDMVSGFVIEKPEEYKTKEEFDRSKEVEFEESVKDFFKPSNALDIELAENKITIKDYKYSTQLEFVNFGEGKVTLEESGLNDLAIDANFDSHLLGQLNSVRGELNIVPINNHIVFHNPQTDRVLVAKPC